MADHNDLIALMPKKEPTATANRKMISLKRETYDRISEIAKEIGTTRTSTVDALLEYYEGTE